MPIPSQTLRRLAGALAVAALALAAAPAEAAKPKAKRPRLAILDFPAASNAWSCAGWANNEGRMSAVLRDLFTSEVSDAGDGQVRLVERERLADLRGELKFQQGDEVDPASVQELGKLLGAQFVLTGKITRFACKRVDAATGWGVGALVGKLTGSSLAGSVAGSAGMKKVNFSGRLDARLIDVETGEIVGTFKEENDAGDLSVTVAGGGVDVPYDEQLVSKVYEPIVAKIAPGVVKKVGKAAGEKAAERAAEADDEEAAPAPRKKKAAAKAADAEGGDEEAAPPPKKQRKAAAGEDEEADAAPAAKGGKKGAGGGAAVQVYGNDFDFVPGEAVLVYDDFSDTEVGDYPARWTIKGGGGGPAEVVEADGRRWFHQRKQEGGGSNSQRTHYAWLRYQVKGDMPAKFTVEVDVLTGDKAWYTLRYNDAHLVVFGPEYVETAHSRIPADPAWSKRQVQHLSIAVSGTSVKAYLGGKRVISDPEAVTRPVTRIGMAIGSSYEAPYDGLLFTNYRLAEGGKDVTQAIHTEGRIVTHGITFDSGADRIRPESGPTLRKILKVLQDDEALALEVQGHTDDQGGAKVNGPLSERRAAAVKAWLVAQGVDEGRLTTKGLGATKPLKPNDSAEGRAENRRVEFVKRGG